MTRGNGARGHDVRRPSVISFVFFSFSRAFSARFHFFSFSLRKTGFKSIFVLFESCRGQGVPQDTSPLSQWLVGGEECVLKILSAAGGLEHTSL